MVEVDRLCEQCRDQLPASSRRHRHYCSGRCRQRAHVQRLALREALAPISVDEAIARLESFWPEQWAEKTRLVTPTPVERACCHIGSTVAKARR
jgi:hypothetical protein